METHKCKWMVISALGCMDNADFEKVLNDNIVLGVLIKFVLIDLQSNSPKRPQSAANEL
jgi:hypothetical protein